MASVRAHSRTPPQPFDLLILNGRVLDGSGNPWVREDLGIRADRIVARGRLAGAAATRTIASRFRFRDFDEYTARRDVFRCDRMFGAGSNQHRQFKLARGFIDGVTGFSARYSSSPLHIRNNDTTLTTDLQRVNEDSESDYLFIDADQGILSVYGLDLTDQWLVVTYNCGLSFAADGEVEDAPDWLSDAAVAQTAIFLRQNRAFQTEGGADDKPLRDALSALETAHARAYPAAVPPTMSEPGR